MASSPSAVSRFVLPLLLAGLTFAHPSAKAQTTDAGCSLQGRVYTCNWVQFKTAFDGAKAIGIETQQIDRQATSQLRHLIAQLGKTAAPNGTPADLYMLLIPVDPSGIDLGPADHDVATLRVYAPNGANPRGTLLWAETYRGQGDRPWPSVVHALILQFQERLTKH